MVRSEQLAFAVPFSSKLCLGPDPVQGGGKAEHAHEGLGKLIMPARRGPPFFQANATGARPRCDAGGSNPGSAQVPRSTWQGVRAGRPCPMPGCVGRRTSNPCRPSPIWGCPAAQAQAAPHAPGLAPARATAVGHHYRLGAVAAALLRQHQQALPRIQVKPTIAALRGHPPPTKLRRNEPPLGAVLVPSNDRLDRANAIHAAPSCHTATLPRSAAQDARHSPASQTPHPTGCPTGAPHP